MLISKYYHNQSMHVEAIECHVQ